MHNIFMAAEQVHTGASHVSSGAQALVTGSTEQAASIEELDASIGEIAQQADENAQRINTATQQTSALIEESHATIIQGTGMSDQTAQTSLLSNEVSKFKLHNHTDLAPAYNGYSIDLRPHLTDSENSHSRNLSPDKY